MRHVARPDTAATDLLRRADSQLELAMAAASATARSRLPTFAPLCDIFILCKMVYCDQIRLHAPSANSNPPSACFDRNVNEPRPRVPLTTLEPLPLVGLLFVTSSVGCFLWWQFLGQLPYVGRNTSVGVRVSLYDLPRFWLMRALKVWCLNISELATSTPSPSRLKGHIFDSPLFPP
jgi:hypothetical protein